MKAIGNAGWRMGLGLGIVLLGFGAARAEETLTVHTDAEGNTTFRHDAINDKRDESYGTIIVEKAPPVLRNEDEYRKASPGDNAVWVPGYWRWDVNASEYTWVSGLWRRAIPSQTWNNGKWVEKDGGYVWQNGYWGSETAAKRIFVTEAPPAPKEELRGTASKPGDVWIPGAWQFDGAKYNWVPGAWESPAVAEMTWVEGAWLKTVGGYEYVPGHWDYEADTRAYVIKKD